MKILACTDGSEQSRKALEEAARIAEGCKADEVAIIYVESPRHLPAAEISQEDIDRFTRLQEEENKKILTEALEVFEKKNIKARTILRKGHPSETIANAASEEGFDMIVMGSRGMGGLKRLLLGSVSNAVANKANTSVLIVK